MNNPCIRCGLQRIDGKSWQEKSGISIVTYTQTLCPDKLCQKEVDKAIADRRAKSDDLAKKKSQLLLRTRAGMKLKNRLVTTI
ncbi:hypothetical protein HYS94_03700 [Candidatus Daviesbacteria bacterium]|nr:hypothetical protein [Candidatus Daviesbacteria bacterium]